MYERKKRKQSSVFDQKAEIHLMTNQKVEGEPRQKPEVRFSQSTHKTLQDNKKYFQLPKLCRSAAFSVPAVSQPAEANNPYLLICVTDVSTQQHYPALCMFMKEQIRE